MLLRSFCYHPTLTSVDPSFFTSNNILVPPIVVPCLNYIHHKALRNTLPEPGLSIFTVLLDSLSELYALWHDGDHPGMDGTQVCILKESNKVTSQASYDAPKAED